MMMPSLYCLISFCYFEMTIDQLLYLLHMHTTNELAIVMYDTIRYDVTLLLLILLSLQWLFLLVCIVHHDWWGRFALLCVVKAINQWHKYQSNHRYRIPERSKKWLAFSDVLIICSKRDCNVLLIITLYVCQSTNPNQNPLSNHGANNHHITTTNKKLWMEREIGQQMSEFLTQRHNTEYNITNNK